MALANPIFVHLFWGGDVTFHNGCLHSDDHSAKNGFPLFTKVDFSWFVDMVYRHVGVSKELYALKLILWYEFNSYVYNNEIFDNNGLETIYFLGQSNPQNQAQIEVKVVSIIPTQKSGFVGQLHNVMQSSRIIESEHGAPSTSHNHVDVFEDEAIEEEEEEDAGDAMSEESNETVESFVVLEELSGDSENEEDDEAVVEESQQTSSVVSRFGFLNSQADADNRLPFDEGDEPIFTYWSKDTAEVLCKGMAFKSKAEFMFAIRLWNIKHSREIIIVDSRPDYVQIKCFTRGKKYNGPAETYPCVWRVTGSSKNKYRIWRISRWVDNHNCYGHVVANNNRCLTSSLIASDIDSQVNKNLAYPVKHIQAHIKDIWNVEISYTKAWNARRISIERIFGTWESNFAELPRYIDELVHTNPDTRVEFQHGPQSTSQAFTFKYIFWAFGPSIRAFNLCIPMICVDGTHLKGNYRGKLLTAVTKNANGQILPVAFAMVDEESNESWAWFLHQFITHVFAQNPRDLCVISDRHQGIVNAVSQIPGWHHRYCLRHIRSNFNKHYKDHQLKRLCWTVGSTTQRTVYLWAIRQIKGINPDAWKYLKDIDPKTWALIRDQDHRRWGNLTTNIAESINNVLRYARLMPIKACIEYTFDYTRKHFIKHYDDASEWNSPLARKMWKLYKFRETRAASHTVTLYDIDQGVYSVRAIGESSGDGGNKFIVKFEEGKCSCGKWQNQRIPCSHVIAACGHREVDPKSRVSNAYRTKTWRTQYKAKFAPLRDVVYWGQSSWIIKADSSRLITHRGRRRSRRIRNEMDEPGNRTRKRPTCRICNGEGHNRSSCPYNG